MGVGIDRIEVNIAVLGDVAGQARTMRTLRKPLAELERLQGDA